MIVRRNMKNSDIYNIALQLSEEITGVNLTLPVKVNFYLQKNISAIMSIAQELEQSRNEILNKYQTSPDENGQYNFEEDILKQVNNELTELFNLEQEVPVYEISLNVFDGVELTSKQVQAISYMIKEEEE